MQKGVLYATMLATMLTARLGRVNFGDHTETYYNLRMDRIVQRAQEHGIEGEYTVRDDGCKMFGPYIIAAADWNIHPYGSVVETSRGWAIILDTGTFEDRTTIDLAVNW